MDFPLCLQSTAQTNGNVLKTVIVPPLLEEQIYSKNSSLLNVSDFIPFKAGDNISISPAFTNLPRKNYFLKGGLKALSAGALAYTLFNSMANNKGGSSSPSLNKAMPALALGLPAGMSDMMKGLHNKKPELLYYLYDRNKILIETQKVTLKGNQVSPVKVNPTFTGFLKVVVLGSKNRITPGNLEINTMGKAPVSKFKGSLASTMDLESEGDCMPTFDPDDFDDSGEDPCGCKRARRNCGNIAAGATISAIASCMSLTIGAVPCAALVLLAYGSALDGCDDTYHQCVKDCKQ